MTFYIIQLRHIQLGENMITYIDQKGRNNLANFKYQGGTASITYQYIWSPLAQYLLKFVPTWVAPNLITLIAFLIVVINHFIFMYAGDSSFQSSVPTWKYVLMGITISVYQNLDNMDGKQARKTKSSSPIGMLFDHGADALTGVLVGLQIIKVFAIKSEDICILMLFFNILYPNFAGLWNQYSVGYFKLDRINPIDEGLPSFVLLCFGGCFFNYENFNNFHIFASYNIQILSLGAVAILFILLKLNKNIFSQSQRQRQDVLKKFLLPIMLVVSLIILKFDISQNIFRDHLYPIVYILMFMWGRNMMLMQVCYVTKQRFSTFNLGTNVYILIIAGCKILHSLNFSTKEIHNYMIIACLVQGLVLLQFIISFLNQAKHILNIEIFSITKKQIPYQPIK